MARVIRGAQPAEVTYILKPGVRSKDSVIPSTPEGVELRTILRGQLKTCIEEERRLLREMHLHPNGGWTITKAKAETPLPGPGRFSALDLGDDD